MYQACSMQLGPKFQVRSVADKNSNLRLGFEKIMWENAVCTVSTASTNLSVAVNWNKRTEIQSEIIDRRIVEIQIWFGISRRTNTNFIAKYFSIASNKTLRYQLTIIFFYSAPKKVWSHKNVLKTLKFLFGISSYEEYSVFSKSIREN